MVTFTKEQLSEVMRKHSEKENGLHDLLEIMLESLMVAERSEFLHEQEDHNKGNGFRFGHTYGHGRKLEFRIPRDRFGNFHPKILAILRDQEEECEKLAGSLYTKGLTQSQVGQVFDEIYGEHYSKSSISRMIDYVRKEVDAWLDRGLDEYYPIVFVDCVHIKVFRKKKAATEAFYVVLAVTEEGTREVLGIYNNPLESATGWRTMFDDIRSRGVERIGLMVADGLTGLDVIVGEKFPGAGFQRCTTHLKRDMMARVRHGDKKALADDMREVFRTGDKDYTVEQGIQAWKDMCLRWGKDYRSIKAQADNEDIAFYFTYLSYVPQIQSMIYTTNWIERLQKDFRRVTRMRGAMPDEDSVIVLMGKTAMDKESYSRVIPRIREDKTLFPNE
jgi:transposase-like protein